jgi:oligosaccharyltransferase complex subunit beta
MQKEELKDEAMTYSYKFRVPQRLGIFRFVIDYQHYGLTKTYVEQEVSVIQWRHDAFPRFLTRAFPFYASAMCLMAGFVIFVVSFMYSEV